MWKETLASERGRKHSAGVCDRLVVLPALQDQEVGFCAEWLNSRADGITVDIGAGSLAGRSLTATASAPLGTQRHSVLSVLAVADSFQAPRLELKLENRCGGGREGGPAAATVNRRPSAVAAVIRLRLFKGAVWLGAPRNCQHR